MHLNSCCALFLLALVACQAAPSSKVLEKSINEAETTFAKNGIELEDTGAEKDRAKKSATTFCVEVRSGKPEQVPCRQEVRPQGIIQQEKPLVIVQPIPIPAPAPAPVPAPVVEYSKQPNVPLQPQLNLIQHQQTANYPPPQLPQLVPQPAPAPAPVQTPAPAPIPIINIVPPAPAPVPCDKPTIVQPQQPQQIHTVHVIHPQPTPRPSVTIIRQEPKPHKEQKPVPKPQPLPIPQQELNVLPQRPLTCNNCKGVIPPHPLLFVHPTAYIDVLPQHGSNGCANQEEAYECSCRPENRIPTPSRFNSRYPLKLQEPRVMTYPGSTTFESMPSMRSMSSMISTADEHPSIMSNQPMFFASEGLNREVEGRHHKKQYNPLNLNVQFPIVYPGSDNSPKLNYYQPIYQLPSTNPASFNYPPSNSYTYTGTYGNYGTYGTLYPESYDSQASGSVPSVTVNAGGPFYGRESQHIDLPSQSSEEIENHLPREMLSTATEIIDASNNQKRETDIVQLNNEQTEVIQNEKENII